MQYLIEIEEKKDLVKEKRNFSNFNGNITWKSGCTNPESNTKRRSMIQYNE